MSIKRIVDTAFWEDSKVIDKYSVEDKYFLLYLMTNPHTTQVGIYKLPKRLISFETGYTVESVSVILERFESKYSNIVYDYETQEIAVLNSLKYSIVKGGKPVADLLIKELSKINNDELILKVYENLMIFWGRSTRDFDKTVKELFENELKKRNVPIIFNDNDNDNDNEESYHDSSWTSHKSVINVDTKPLETGVQKENGHVQNVQKSVQNKNGQNKNGQKVFKNDQLENFEKLWKLYPRKKRKDRAYKAYKKAIKEGTTNKQIQDGIINFKKEIAYKGIEMNFIPYGSTWFNGKCWEDEYETGTSNQPVNYQSDEINRLEKELQNDQLEATERIFMTNKLAELKGRE